MTVYVFDSGPLIDLFKHYYPGRFPSLWEQFDAMIDVGRITSTREVQNELDGSGDELSKWCKRHRNLFEVPSVDELRVVGGIFAVTHFQAMIRKQERMAGRPVADPFVIARARSVPDGCVVTTEKESAGAAKIPNVCEHFGVDWTNLEGFMEREDWRF